MSTLKKWRYRPNTVVNYLPADENEVRKALIIMGIYKWNDPIGEYYYVRNLDGVNSGVEELAIVEELSVE